MTSDTETRSEAEAWLADEKNATQLEEAKQSVLEGSTTGESEARINFRFEDGSLVAINSFQGSEPIATAYDSSEAVPVDLIYQHLSEEQQVEADAATQANIEAFEAAREEAAEEPSPEQPA